MTRRLPQTAVATMFTLLMISSLSAASADTLVMPQDLVTYAHTLGCSQLVDFFERPGMIEPPFVYGIAPGEKEDSAAFWCEKAVKGTKAYLLAIKIADEGRLGGCPTKIEWWNHPRGLSVEHRGNLDLRRFHFVNDPKRSAPAATVPKATVIVSYYDGVSDEFYCYDGSWLYATAH